MKTVPAIDVIDLQWFTEEAPPPAAPPAPDPTPPPAAPEAAPEEIPDEWKGWWAGQLNKEIREKHKDGLLELKGKQIGDVFDDYFESRERYKNAVIFPDKDAKPEEIEAFLKHMDIPKTAEEYGFDPKQLPIQGTDEQKAVLAKGIADFAKSIGLTKNQAAKVYQQYQGIIKNVLDAGANRQKDLAGTFEERLLKDAGDEKTAGETKEHFKRALIALGDKQLVKELGESGMLYSTAFVRGMADIWKAGNQEPPIVHGPGGTDGATKDALPKGDEFNKHYGSRRK
ncbi:MAG: hypothetical protein LBS57_12400 [Treponema sp.]|jgi:hypothetical protein|nr:hypothetical protein [Treponema sp.]